ncbi:MAG: two-component system response regulator [Desulfovibrionaceae bacterium]
MITAPTGADTAAVGGTKKPIILIVDDTPANIRILTELLRTDYTIRVATNGEIALHLATIQPPPDLILLDIMMPNMDGYEVCQRLKSQSKTAGIPIIFVTAMTDADDEAKGLDLGAVDYVTKPFNPRLIKGRIRNHLELKKHRDNLAELVAARTAEVFATRAATIESLASLAETRDPETGGHIHRTQRYVKLLAERLRIDAPSIWGMNDATLELLYLSAPLHDIGKVGVPDSVLLKPDKLTAEEFEQIKLHTTFGYQSLTRAEKRLGNSSFLRLGAEIAYSHHEKWDGTGYPRGLSGENIPQSGRLMALGDVYDALISRRIYKPPLPHSKAMAIILEGRGTHFDPMIVDAFLSIAEEMRTVASDLADFQEEKDTLLL